MIKFALISVVLVLSANMIAFADDVDQVITLKDGSQIKGVLSEINNGYYTVKEPMIGDVQIAANDVVSITNSNAPVVAPAQAPAAVNMDQQIAATQQKLAANPQAMAELQQMAQDPDIQQILQDPALIKAVTSHDYQAVQSSPAVQKLLANPQMQALIQKMAAQQQQQNSSSQ